MPKIKTNKSAAKRFRVTKNKKFKFQKVGRRHRLENASPKSNRHMRQAGYVHPADQKNVQQLLPYA